ncbi:MAG: hypothetical protein V2I36_18620 [Desulfopila sp.]|jgi:hypothetical protein|nr:hypothetical protein [Desulfopila sp.]
MRAITLIFTVAVCLILSACGGKSAKEKMMEEEMKTKSEVRMKLLKQYNSCISEAKGNADQIKECESLLQAADKVK